MSQENIELVRGAFDAFSRDGWDALIGFLDPEIEWVTTGQFVGGQLYRGHEGARDFLDALRVRSISCRAGELRSGFRCRHRRHPSDRNWKAKAGCR
jgi:ketosteroid isomerase-like protein